MSLPMLDAVWRLDGSVALRPEPFGALAYHFGNRKLVFLKRPELVAVVRELGEGRVVRDALADAGVPESSWPAYVAALAGLAESAMLHRVEERAA
jgi:putative mycofactocin binding protein MftB